MDRVKLFKNTLEFTLYWLGAGELILFYKIFYWIFFLLFYIIYNIFFLFLNNNLVLHLFFIYILYVPGPGT